MCESYSGPAKSDPIKRLTQLTSGPLLSGVNCLYKYSVKVLISVVKNLISHHMVAQ